MVEVYFAYGSNLDQKQMKDRCPCFKLVGIAKKTDFQMTFPRCSEKQKGGVASIEESRGDVVWGALYGLTPADVRELNRKEGVQSGKYRKVCGFQVIRPDGTLVQAYTYIANKCGSFKPHRDYLYKIIGGAQEWGLPPAYIEKLKRIPYKEES